MRLLAALVLLTSTLALSQDAGVVPAAPADAADARAAALMEALRKQHKGPGPCYRWDRRSAVTGDTIATTAVMLKQKKLGSDDVAAVVPLFIKWADEIDQKAHKLSERDEFRKVVRDLAPPEEQAKIDKNPKALDALADKVVSKPVDTTKAQAAFDKLPKAKQTALKEVFKAHPAALRLSFLDVLVTLKKLEKPAEMMGGEQHDDHGHGH